MFSVVIGVILILFGIRTILRRKTSTVDSSSPRAAAFSLLNGPMGGILMLLAGLAFLTSTSFVLISAEKVGHLKRIYLAADLPPGRIIALPGQKGPQAEVLGPGFHFRPLLNVLYDVEPFDLVMIPEGFYGQVTTLDGQPMPDGMFMAPVIADNKLESMFNAETFLTTGGYRGPQETVLKVWSNQTCQPQA
jgi:hypothetical protein